MGRRVKPFFPSLLCAAVLAVLGGCSGDVDAEAEPPGEREPQEWAVVVGISDYQSFPELERGTNDAEKMLRLLRGWDIPEENIRVLLNQEATKEAISEALVEWLPERVRSGDRVTVYLSGYASRIEDTSGDEEDGIDVGFCPVDAQAEAYDRDIIDDQLQEWIGRLPTGQVTLIVESEHEGHGDHDPDHSGHEEHAGEFDLDPIGVSRCGDRPMGWTTRSDG